jgi:hypothetical protein
VLLLIWLLFSGPKRVYEQKCINGFLYSRVTKGDETNPPHWEQYLYGHRPAVPVACVEEDK